MNRTFVSTLAAASLVAVLSAPALGGASPGRIANSQGPDAPDRAPDTYVAAWDAIGAQAFTAAGLTPAEGHTIFAYVAIAVYDSAMAVQEDYEPFLVDADAPAGASAEAAVAAAAYRVLAHYLPAQEPSILTAGLRAHRSRAIPDSAAKE